MLQIILLIFKIIGLLLLSLLGLLLLLLLLVLFVPIRYRITAAHGEEYFRLESRISWLLHILHARISVKDSSPWIRLRLFGFLIFDNLRVKKERRKKNITLGKKIKKSKLKSSRNGQNKNANRSTSKDTLPKRIQPVEVKTKTETTKTENLYTETAKTENIKPSDLAFHAKELSFEDQEGSTEKRIPEKNIPITHRRIEKERSKHNIKSLFERLKNFLHTLKTRVVGFFNSLISKIKKLLEAAGNLRHKISLIKAFIRDEINREVFRLTLASIKKLLKHILPTKLKSSIIFGTGDPCSTGQALGAFAILYSFYGDKVQITPDFENKRFEGKHYARGRIRLVTILIIVIKLIIDRRFKQFIGNMKTLKEAL